MPCSDLQVVSTRAAFSDEFAAQYASCFFYKADGTKVRTTSVCEPSNDRVQSTPSCKYTLRRKLSTSSHCRIQSNRHTVFYSSSRSTPNAATRVSVRPKQYSFILRTPYPLPTNQYIDIPDLKRSLLPPYLPNHLARSGRWMQLVWECRTDAVKFFFPPADFDPSPAPAMLSCTTLDTTPVGLSHLLSPAPSEARQKPVDDGTSEAGPRIYSAPERDDIGGSRRRKKGAIGQGGDNSLRQNSLDVVGEQSPGDESGGVDGEAAAVAGVRRGRPGRQPGSRIGGGGGERHNKTDKVTTGISLLRPYVIDLEEKVRQQAPKPFMNSRKQGSKLNVIEFSANVSQSPRSNALRKAPPP